MVATPVVAVTAATNRPTRFGVKGLRDWFPSTFLYTLTLDGTDLGLKDEVDFFVFDKELLDFIIELEHKPDNQYELCKLLYDFLDRMKYGNRDSYKGGGSYSMPWPTNDFERTSFALSMEVPILIDLGHDDPEYRKLVFPLYVTDKTELRGVCKKNFTKYRIGKLGETFLEQDPYAITIKKDVLTFMSLTGRYKIETLPWEML